MTRSRIAVVTTYYRPVLGGAESAAERLATYLQRRGHDVTVFTKRTSPDHAAAETIDDVRVVRLPPVGPRTAWGKWAMLPRLYRSLVGARESIDLVVCVDYRGIGLSALAARRVTKTPVVFYAQTEGVLAGGKIREWAHAIGVSTTGAMASALTFPVRALYRRADVLGCISRGIEREALAAGMPRARVYYVPNPVDTRRFSPASPDERRALRRSLEVGDDEVLAVFVGRLSREKGAVELAQAWGRLRPRATLVFIGPPMTGHPWDVSGDVRRIIDDAGVANTVRILGGQTVDVVANWLRAADLAIQPSHFEAMGLAAAEALAAGVPVIASDTGGYRDFIVDGTNGRLVPTKDVAALSEAIARLIADPAARARLASHARATGEQFDENVVLERFAEVMDRLVAGKAAVRGTP